MKILKYILFTILALIILFLLVGLIHPEVGYGAEITVDKPVEEAWAVLQDDDKYADWLEGFKSEEMLTGEKGEVGSTSKVIVNPGDGQEDFEMIQTLKSIEEFEHVEMEFDSEMMDFHQRITLVEADGQTTIKTDSKVMGKGMMMKSMFALMEMLGSSFTKQEVKNMNSLKELINNNTTDYYPAPVEMPVDSMEVVEPVEQ
jgi:carbon monoxide dehydrogenase subunit G